MSRQRQSILVSGAILAAVVWLFAFVMLFSQPGSSVNPSSVPTLASLPNIGSETEQVNAETVGEVEVENASSESTALPIVVLNPPSQTNVNPVPVSGGDIELPAVSVPAEPVPNTIIVRFDAGSSEEERAAYIQSIGGQVTQTIDALNTVVVTVPEGVTLDTLPPAPIVSQYEPDFYIGAQASPPNDPLYSGQWGLDVVRAPEAWTLISADSPRITVAVVDSGICANHPDLSGRIGGGWDFVQSDDVPQDDYGHGCAVAGVIAANGNNNVGIAGVAPNVDIMPLRVLDGQGVGMYSRVAAAIVYATDNGAQIINLSLGGSNPSGVLQNAVNYAASHNVMVVAAAGNGGSPTAMYPAAYESVIAVGSVDNNLQRSSFSNYGPQVDLYAPGSNIASTGLNGYVTMSGTSLATPYVSGVAALEMALGSSLVVDGGIVTFQESLQVEPTPGSDDVLTCNHDQSYQAYLTFEDLVQQQVENPASVTDDQIKAARRAYLEAANDCFVLAYNNGPLTIDNEGQWIDGEDANAQFHAFGTKWGANSPFPMLQPPAVSGGTVTFSFMPSGVSLALKEGVPSNRPEIAVINLVPAVTENFPDGECDLQLEIRNAILLWSNVANIEFQEVIDNGQPFNAASGVVGNIRIGSHFIDGEGDELGHAFFPGPVPGEPNASGVGDLFFDSGDNWGCETETDVAGNITVLDIGIVTTHEIGHAIGLRHQNAPPGAVMNPTYDEDFGNLAPDDIDGVRAIYGVDTLEAPPLLPVALSGNIATFNWTEVAGGNASQYQIQVALASDSAFSAPVIDTTVSGPPFTANAPLDNNTYVWRVRGFLDAFGPYSNLTSPNATFTVAFGVPNLVAPLNGEIVSNSTITFQWGSAGASTDTFVLQVATGTQFDSTDLLQNIPNISGLNRTVSGFADGVYYWRVAKTGNDFSLPFQFSVDSNVPGLTFPPNDSLLSDDDVDFTWLPVPGATEYQIQIDTSPNFAGLLFLDKLFLDKLFLDKLFLDKLFLDKLFLDKLFLDKLFLDKLFLDKLFLDKLFLDKLFLDKLFLDKLFLDKLFLDKLFLDKLFLDKLTSPEASFDTPLSEGLHYWRVRARRSDGEWGGWSQTFSFRIETRPNIVVNEIKVTDPSFIEIYNAGTSAEDLTGWTLNVYQPDSLTPSFSFTFPPNCMGGESGCTLGAGDYLVLHEASGVNDEQNIYLGTNTINWPLPGEDEGVGFSASGITATALPIVEAPVVSAPAIEAQEVAGVSGRVYLDTVTAQSIITVNTVDMAVADDGQCSLIEAITTANTDTPSGGQDFECETSGGEDTIVLEADGPYILSTVDNNHDDTPNGTPVVESEITIEGNGQTITRSSEASFRIFYVTSDGTLTVNNLTVSSGFAGSFASGGAFRNVGGTLVLNNVNVTSNLAGTGGAIASSSGSLTSVNNSLIENNGAVNAIGGGGIYNEGIMTITDTTIRDNETEESAGGGVFNDGLFAIVTLNRSTVSGNHAGEAGGGLRNESGLLVLLNSTVSGNTVSSAGGAIYNSGGSVNISFSTINANSAVEGVGGLYTSLGGAVQLRHSIISNNSTLNCFSENGESFATSGTILETDGSCIDASVSSEELNLGPLQNNGGPTETHALLDGSVAIDVTEECTDVENNEVTFDQRSVVRPQNSLCDIGAFEVGGEGGDTPQGNPYFVNTTALTNDGVCGIANCTIIEAVNAANADGIESTVNLQGEQTYNFQTPANAEVSFSGNSALPIINTIITINGNDALIRRDDDFTCPSVTNAFRLIRVDSPGTLTLNNVTLQNGCETDDGAGGGAIFIGAGGQMVINNSTISNNTSDDGGGAIRNDGTLIIDESLIEGNSNTSGFGGGIDNVFGGNLTITDSTIRNNSSTSNGGGISNFSGSTILIRNSTLSGNSGFNGAGIYNENSTVNLVNVTVSGNTANGSGAGAYTSGDFFAVNVTFANNNATLQGSGINYTGGNVDFKNSIMANIGDNCAVSEFSGTVTFGGSGSNLATDENCGFGFGFAPPSSLLLGPLSSNGGLSQTHALLDGSEAIDGVENCTTDGETFLFVDQRGVSRPQGGACDIGAFEFEMAAADEPQSNPYIVNTLDMDDDGVCGVVHCSLIEAIHASNTDDIVSTIHLGFNQSYLLTDVDNVTDGANGLPSITTNVTINGNGSTIIREGDAPEFRILHISSGGGNLTLNNVTLRQGKLSDGAGGAIRNNGTLVLNRSTLHNNRAEFGGGLTNFGTATVDQSAILDNTVLDDGGGIYNDGEGASLTITNSTIASNSTEGSPGVGGGLLNIATLTLNNVTITDNTADEGGGIYFFGGPVSASNTIFANNSASNETMTNCSAPITNDNGSNLEFPAGGCGEDFIESDPLLGARFGSPAFYPLQEGSPAIDAGDDETCESVDQRGASRPQGASCDIGAFEFGGEFVFGTIGGAVALIPPSESDAVSDFIRFGDTNIPAPDGTSFTGGTVDLPPDPQNIGRDPASSDSDHRTDIFTQKPSRGGQNAVTVVINEVFPGTIDAIELFNPSVETVRMDGWQIFVYDQAGNVDATFNFPSNFELQPNRYVVLRETAGVNTDSDLFMNDSISWPSTNPAGTVLLTNGDSDVDLLVFGNEAINELGTDAGWIGPSPLPPLPNEALGRDSVSSDTDAGADWYQQIPSLGSVNPMARPLPNDDFGDAIEILTVPFRDITNTSGAEMTNVGEPDPSCGFNVGFQVWYKYTPPVSTVLRFQTDGSKIDTVLSIWTDATTEVGCDDDSSPDDTRSRIDLALTGGTTYFIGVGGKNNTPGQVVLSLLPPANDDFNEAIEVGGLPFTDSQNTIAASSPLDDPTTSCGSFDGRSVWYSFTAVTNEAVRFHTEGSNFNTILSVWTGARGTLAQIDCNDNIGETALSSISLQPVVGETYYIMAGGPSDSGGQLIFNATLLIPPPNDDFVNSINVEDLETDPYDENTLGATEEDLDPVPSCGINTSKTVWFTYEADSTQTFAFQTFGSNFDTVLAIWSEDLSTELGCNDDEGAGRQSYLEFSGVPGETYYIVVSGHQGEGGDLIFEAFPLGTPPDNDEPEGAFVVSPLPYTLDQPENEIVNATVSVNEPSPTCGVDVSKTVWYVFTADGSSTFSIETLGSDYDTVLAVYTDIGGVLTEVVCDDDAIVDGTSRVLLNATGGTTYLIMVGGWNGDSGNLHLEVEAVDTAPTFDDDDTPKIIPSVPYDDSDSTVFATDAFDDPVPTCGVSVGKTVWYQYTPASNALLLFDTNGSSFDTNLSIYLVTLDGLTEVACDDDSGEGLASFVEFAPETGETYLIMIGGTSGSSGQLNLHVEAVEPPANDEIENATDLSDVFVLDLIDVRGATNAGDDPAHSCNANTGRTVWYTVTPTQLGTMSFNTLGSGYNTVMSVYEAENDGSLTEIACDDNSGENLTSRIDNLTSQPNQTYYIMISGAFGETGNLNFNVALLVPPANDEIEGAFDIIGTVFDFNQDTTGASNAPDDPLSCGLLAGKTVWYDYAATGNDLLRIDVSGSEFNTIVAAYTGDRGSLTQIGCEFFGALDIVTQPGETYHILIGGFGGESGNLDLHAEVVGIPENDPIDGAFEIPSMPYTNTQSTVGATRVNEPPVTCDFTVGKTVWYQYSANGNEGLLHFDSEGSDFSTVITVYQDTESGLVQVGCNTFGAVEVPAEAGDYFIMIGGWRGKSGQLVFNASSIPQPDNDEFENGTEVGQLPFTDDRNTDGASSDSGDPLTCDPGSGKTVWYVFHSIGDGTLHISTDGSLFNTVIAVYKPDGPPIAQVNFGPLLNFDLLACEKGNQLDVPVEGGQTYYIMISGEEGDSGQLHIEITGDITPTPPHITVEKIANPGEVSEPGGEVLFTVHVKNSSIFGLVTINSIVDDVYGNVCADLLQTTINAGDTLTCTFTQFVGGQPGDDHSNTLHVSGIHETGAPVEDSADATVTIINLPSSINVTKTANPVSLTEPGGLVEFTVNVENTSAADNVSLTSLVDNLFGDMSLQCGLPVDLTPGQTFSCVFTGNINGESGDTQVNTVEVSGTDDDGELVSGLGSAVVSITCAAPDPERDLRGSLPSRTRGVITNTSPDCFYVVGMASYERPDDNIDNQHLFDYSSAVIGPNQTLNLFIDVPTCALQVDLFYGEVLYSLANGTRYGTRLLANRVSTNLPFCDFSQDQFNLSASPEDGTTNVHLNWTDNLLVEVVYHIERSNDGSNFSEIAVVPADTTSYLDSGLCYTHYWYRIRAAFDIGGPFTAYSSVAEVTTSCPALAAPSDLSATAVSDSQIDLAWTDNSSDETDFHIERSPDGVTWTEIASVPANTTSYQDGGLTCAAPYQYRVRAFRSIDAQFSAYTNIAGNTTDACPPPPLPAPSELNAVAISDVQIELGWTDNSSDETAFNIERSPDGSTWSPLASVPADTIAYQDNILTCATTYHYRVFAFRSGDSQTSDASNIANATTFACPIILSVVEPTSNTVGLYKDGQWQFRNAADETAPVLSFTFGETGWLPVIGDWDGDGTDGLGLYKDGQWILRSSVGGVLSDTTFAFGTTETDLQPVVGDWNGDGIDTVGLYKAGQWLLRNSNAAGNADITFAFGQNLPGALPIAGDWNGDGIDTIGLYLNGQWHLLDALITIDSVTPIAFGPAESGWQPVVGDWNGDGADTIGLVKDGLWRLRNSNGDGATDLGFSFDLGATGWLPVGNFSGDLSALGAFLANQPITVPPTITTPDPATATEAPTVTETPTPEVSETPVSEVTETEVTPSETATEDTITGESVTDATTEETPPTEPPTPEIPAPEGTSEAG